MTFDPSQMDPKVLMEMSNLIRELPPEKIMKMQTLMHNMMAGFDVRSQMEEFERDLPPEFRQKLMSVMASAGVDPLTADQDMRIAGLSQGGAGVTASRPATTVSEAPLPANEREARLTILRAVAEGRMSPEDAESLLFS
jgi:hypothetical protein